MLAAGKYGKRQGASDERWSSSRACAAARLTATGSGRKSHSKPTARRRQQASRGLVSTLSPHLRVCAVRHEGSQPDAGAGMARALGPRLHAPNLFHLIDDGIRDADFLDAPQSGQRRAQHEPRKHRQRPKPAKRPESGMTAGVSRSQSKAKTWPGKALTVGKVPGSESGGPIANSPGGFSVRRSQAGLPEFMRPMRKSRPDHAYSVNPTASRASASLSKARHQTVYRCAMPRQSRVSAQNVRRLALIARGGDHARR